MRGRRLLVAFGAWTVFVWATRIGTALDEGAEGRAVLAAAFTVVGVGLLALAWRARGRVLDRGEVLAVRAAAAWTIGVWVVRGVQITLADHDAAFIAVHLVLAVVSIALAVAAEVVRRDRIGEPGARYSVDPLTDPPGPAIDQTVLLHEWSDDGALGDARLANAELGRAIADAAAERTLEFARRFMRQALPAAEVEA